ncbi:DedA family protein [Lacisediminihabitans changchengi]|uniref:VTT domain-containing protein n=1 Tax=Lacisediminihabitans changchengi TaxID=2787634 RepID=A0A934STL6_9MICO|nr:VTT domain-containing protein [Lacisediminihabitans changchengi]MBK4346998.1 VTT domain-containing protein [Lacisediminihabitans changchengi]MBK4347879.1 VTT domain-containing protein [Lacisediminihabitans changchengi]
MNLSELLLTIASSPWAFVVLATLLIVDGFFPLVPGETTVVILTSLGAAGLGPSPLAVLLVSIAATMVGDGVAFWIGRAVGTDRWGWMRRPRISRALTWAAGRIEKHPAAALIGAKFLPYARVAVTMTAGATGLSTRRYLPLSLAASSLYTGYHVLVASVAGAALAANPLAGVAVSLGVGALLSATIAAVQRLRSRRERGLSVDRPTRLPGDANA